jgi:hypothetical protein
MKKVRTGATKQSRNFSQQRLTIGLDLADGSSWRCVLDDPAHPAETKAEHNSQGSTRGVRGMPHRRAYPCAAITTPIASEAIKRSRERQASVVVDLPLARPSHTKRSHRCEGMGNS